MVLILTGSEFCHPDTKKFKVLISLFAVIKNSNGRITEKYLQTISSPQ